MERPNGDLRELLGQARLYVVSAEGAPVLQAASLCAALDGGADLVQLRNKTAAPGALMEAAATVATHARMMGRIFIVNDHLDVAIAAGADGVHLGQDDLPPGRAREVWGPGPLVGVSTHSLEQVRTAVRDGADYIGVGPLFATPTKPGRPAVGLALVSEVAALAPGLPWFAIGGIDPENIDDVFAAGATRVAVVRAVAAQPDPAGAAREIRRRIEALAAAPAL